MAYFLLLMWNIVDTEFHDLRVQMVVFSGFFRPRWKKRPAATSGPRLEINLNFINTTEQLNGASG